METPEAFRRLPLEQFTIAHYSDQEPDEARRIITALLETTNFTVNVSPVSREELVEIAGDICSLPDHIVSAGVEQGMVWVLAFVDDSEHTAPIQHGKPVAFDTVTGRAVTGVNAAWEDDEFKIVGTAWKSFSGPGFARIPVTLHPSRLLSQAESAETTTTTTTLPPCSGNCKFVWSDSSQAWIEDTNNCTNTTTTTPSPTSTTVTTTTTALPCPTTTPGPGTTTTPDPTTTTTTTTPSPCHCSYPKFCGTEDGECTFTDCTNNEEVLYVDCTTTQTTTTTGGPTTTCDCNTTTTAAPSANCTAGCDWIWIPVRGWIQKTFGCGEECPCPAPTGGAPEPCEEAHTNCVPTTQPPSPIPCGGLCHWWWDDVNNEWVLTEYGCTAGVVCSCFEPTRPGIECEQTTTNCQSPPTTTTTSVPGSCWECYTTTTVAPTTTTPGPCDGGCRWAWDVDNEEWDNIEDDCDASCPCGPPPFVGQESCERAESPCGPPTTTTTTTTTTTCQPCPPVCEGIEIVYYCGGDGSWIACTPPQLLCVGVPPPPPWPCENCETQCVPCSTTTTTTTTTCNPVDECAGAGCAPDEVAWTCVDGQWLKCPGSSCSDPGSQAPTPTDPCTAPNCATACTPCSTTTTTTTEPPTTTTTTTTTTTGCPSFDPGYFDTCSCCNVWHCSIDGHWQYVCHPNVFCVPGGKPPEPCEPCTVECNSTAQP